MTSPQPIIYLDPETNEFKLDEGLYDHLFTSEETKFLPVAIVSVAGDFRKGKSFLLNFFLRYLQEKPVVEDEWVDVEDDPVSDWIGDVNEPLKGFSWKSGVERDTKGIIFWPEPFIITRKDGKKIAVLLMDTQGLFDDQTGHTDVGRFYTISSLVSSLQIYNQMNNIQSNDITTLSAFSEYGQRVKGKTGHKAFQNLLILIRDWRNSSEFSHGHKGGQAFLEFKKKSLSDKFGSSWKQLEDCYSDIDCFLMPSIGDDASEDINFDGRVSKIRKTFIAHLNQLASLIFSPESIPLKTIDGEEQCLWQIGNYIQNLTDGLKDNAAPDVNCLLFIGDQAKVDNVFSKAVHQYVNLIADYMARRDAELTESRLAEFEKTVNLYFQDETRLIDENLKKEKFDELQKLITKFNIRALQEKKGSKFFEKMRVTMRNNLGKISIAGGIVAILGGLAARCTIL